ncbi:hypothetical protein GCM10008018_34380 [Paenibacillus marchantiophytorum]|uniref:histidine kinase n=1 Tax=Paenibacillus marchantiophytorum TaxID=1619310 RepID=A0ABQ1ESL6_9BACL|nr:ATP-binding protein [Paenibacillus marchantiophytorum]GFZ85404.1 hypothetical protein GCM10008018_34380 [Paenibacillus marchantiophytorum]
MSKYKFTMTKRKIWLISIAFLLILTGLRLMWFSAHKTPVYPQAVQGVLDLRNETLSDRDTIPLDGEWEFIPNILAEPAADLPHAQDSSSYVQVPSKRPMILLDDKKISYTYGTYRLRILIHTTKQQSLGIRISDIQTASELFVNGQSLNRSGNPSDDPNQFIARNVPYFGTFITDRNEIDVLIHVSNSSFIGKGGIVGPIKFGTEQAITYKKYYSMGLQLVVCVVLILHAFYAGLLVWMGKPRRALTYFFLLILSTIITVLVDDDRLLLVAIPFDFGDSLKIQFISYTGAAAFLLLFAKHMFPEYGRNRVFNWFVYTSSLFSLFVLFAPTKYTVMGGFPFLMLLLLPNLLIPAFMLHAALKKVPDAVFLLLGAISIMNTTVWGIIKNVDSLEMTYYPFDLIFAFLGFAAYWFKAFYRNAAETKVLAQKLSRADKLKDDFLANTSHELRNPLHGIMNMAQAVLDSQREVLNEANTRNMELLLRVGKRMSFLLNDLLDLNIIAMNASHLYKTNLQLRAVAAGVIDTLRFMTEGKPLRLILQLPPDLPPVLADENRLIQILFNLIHNAIKFTHEGDITLKAYADKDHVHISISDTGIGIDPAAQRHIFERYEQADPLTASAGGGLGLGLSISSKLVELHGGTLTVSSSPGEGSIFSFTLPVYRQDSHSLDMPIEQAQSITDSPLYPVQHVQAPAAAAVEAIASAEGRQRILAVDDDSLNLTIILSILASESYEVVPVMSAKEALVLLDSEQWDLVITDVMMPNMSGYELSRRIRERFALSELPILLLTARSRPEDLYAGFQSGANDYVTKPMDAVEFRSRVRALTNLKKVVSEQLRVEAAWLHAQIKPHFLFNSLNAIAALGDIDVERMKQLLDEFSTYLRSHFDIGNLDRVIPLENELQLVRSYLAIEQERFAERLEVIWAIDAPIHIWVPPLSIQTLVENALNHGILQRARGGTLMIRVEQTEDSLTVAIIDNGVGIETKKLQKLLDPHPGRRGIGLYNTHSRLKQLYGTGLHIQSTVSQGTTVSFTIPLPALSLAAE